MSTKALAFCIAAAAGLGILAFLVQRAGHSQDDVGRANPSAEAYTHNTQATIGRLPANVAGPEHPAGFQDEPEMPAAGELQAIDSATPQPSQYLNTSDSTMPAAAFLKALTEAVASGDIGAIREVLEAIPQSMECIEELKTLVAEPSSNAELSRYAAEALMRIGTTDAARFVVGQILQAQNKGQASLATSLLASLDTPATVNGASALFELLLGMGQYAGSSMDITDPLRTAARKALLNAPDRDAVGHLAADLYLDLQTMGRQDALLELTEGVSHPGMLSELAIRACESGAAETASQWLQRLSQVSDQGVVSAFARVAAQEPALLNQTAKLLYTWSITYPEQAQPGLFMEYLTDSSRPSSQRILAAYGLSGTQDSKTVIQTLNKVLALEQNSALRAPLSDLLSFVSENQQYGSQESVQK